MPSAPDEATGPLSAGRCIVQVARETTSDDPEADAILTRFRAALGEIHGDRLERAVLYGARGRSPARFGLRYRRLHQDPSSLGEEIRLLAGVETDILGTGAVINALPFRAGAYRGRTGFMHELRRNRKPPIATWAPSVPPAL